MSRTMLLLSLGLLLLPPLAAQQPRQHPALPTSGTIAVGAPPRGAAPRNTTYVLPCIHEESEFAHRRRSLLVGHHREQPLQPRQRIVHFGHCWQPLCFRGVYDAFATEDETEHLFRKFEPLLKEDEARKAHGQGGYIGYTLKPRNEDEVLERVVRRMSALLDSEFGAKGAVPASTNLRSLRGESAAPRALEGDFEERWLAGKVPHSGAGVAWHWDNTKKMDWLYTCLLYIGSSDTVGGATLFVDEVAKCGDDGGYQDCVSTGMMVAPVRSRLLCFSSGAENVHAGSSNFGGYRVLFQVWWKCEGDDIIEGEAEPGRRRNHHDL
jgi:hypothetical protein